MPTHSLLRLSQSIHNVPHLITPEALSPIIDYLSSRNYGADFAVLKDATKTKPEKKMESAGGIGEIVIDGPLTYKPVYAMCSPEGASYEKILAQAEELIDMGVTTIVMTHSSPGGQASHAFSTATELRRMADENGVKLISYIDTYSASASYLLAVIADEVIIHPEASAGSIGCVVAILDKSKAMANAGLKPIYITSTAGKVPFDESGQFTSEFLADIQADVTRLGDKFVAHVAEFTGMSEEAVRATNANMFHAEKALELGLVNKIMDHNTFAAYVADLQRST